MCGSLSTSNIQRIAEEELAAGIQRARTASSESTGTNLVLANAGSVVVIDPNTGGIVAMLTEAVHHPVVVSCGDSPRGPIVSCCSRA